MSGEKILVADDEKIIREVFLSAFEEYNIVPAASGEEVLDILKKPNDIDLIVLDVVMPGLAGTELLKQIKIMNPNHKVIILTGYGSKEVIIEALRNDADEYIEKPFDIQKVKEVFERLLGQRKNFDERGIDCAKSKIEEAKKFIERNYDKPLSLKDVSQGIYLSPKYFSRMFKEKSGRTFNQHRLGLRMKAAKQLLKKFGYTVSQISARVGYHNPDSFMKAFKKITGLTPSEYRRRNRQNRRRG